MGVKRARPEEKIVRPFQEFADKTSSGGILLIAAAIVALVWANDRTPFVVPLTMRVFVRILAARLPSPRTLSG